MHGCSEIPRSDDNPTQRDNPSVYIYVHGMSSKRQAYQDCTCAHTHACTHEATRVRACLRTVPFVARRCTRKRERMRNSTCLGVCVVRMCPCTHTCVCCLFVQIIIPCICIYSYIDESGKIYRIRCILGALYTC